MLPFNESDGEHKFLLVAADLSNQAVGLLLLALDAANDPDIASAVTSLRAAVSDRASGDVPKSFQASKAIVDLVSALNAHPNYRAYMRTWDVGRGMSFRWVFFKRRWLPRWRRY